MSSVARAIEKFRLSQRYSWNWSPTLSPRKPCIACGLEKVKKNKREEGTFIFAKKSPTPTLGMSFNERKKDRKQKPQYP